MAEVAEIFQSFRRRRPYRLRVILLCTAAATTFWFLNALNKEHTTTLNYPLVFLYDEQAYIAVEEPPASVLINVNSNGWNLLKNSIGIKVSPLRIALNNPRDQKKIAASIIPSLITDQLSDFQLNYVLTDTLRIDLDRRVSRYVMLDADTSDIVLEPLRKRTSGIRVAPDSMRVEGPQRFVDAIGDTINLKIDQTPVGDNFREMLEIPLKNELLSLEIDEAEVSFDVISLIEQSYRVKVDTEGFNDSTLSIFPDEVVIYALLPESIKDAYTPEDFVITVDMNDLSEDSTFTPVISEYPIDIEDIRLDTLQIQLLKD